MLSNASTSSFDFTVVDLALAISRTIGRVHNTEHCVELLFCCHGIKEVSYPNSRAKFTDSQRILEVSEAVFPKLRKCIEDALSKNPFPVLVLIVRINDNVSVHWEFRAKKSRKSPIFMHGHIVV